MKVIGTHLVQVNHVGGTGNIGNTGVRETHLCVGELGLDRFV